jgi:hypothetical protein
MIPGNEIPLSCVVPITKMTREQWVRYQWHDITTVADAVRQLVRCHYRTPDEAYRAAEQWDYLASQDLLPEIDL